MAKQVQKYQSDAGGLFDSKLEALKDDLRHHINSVIGNEKAAKDVADYIASNLAPVYPPKPEGPPPLTPQEPTFVGFAGLITELFNATHLDHQPHPIPTLPFGSGEHSAVMRDIGH